MMVIKKEQRPLSDFSLAVASEVRDLMRTHDITQAQIAKEISRTQAFVSERVSGVKPIDTAIIDAVAKLAGLSGSAILTEVAIRVENSKRSNVIPLRKNIDPEALPHAAYKDTEEPGLPDDGE